MIKVSGNAPTPQSRPTAPPTSWTSGYVKPYVTAKARASSLRSCVSIPTNATPCGCASVIQRSCKIGASSLQGSHHEAQKLTTTTWPRSDARVTSPSPVSSGSAKSGAGGLAPDATSAGNARAPDDCMTARASTMPKPSNRTATTTTTTRFTDPQSTRDRAR